MPATYTLITSSTLTTSAASVTLNSIPSTYTDLVLRLGVRNTSTTNSSGAIYIEFNGSAGTAYSQTELRGNGSTVTTARDSSAAYIPLADVSNRNGNTANTFSNVEIYIPSYLASANKPVTSFGVAENNATSGWMNMSAGLWRNTSAITSIKITGSDTFTSGCSFWLYGIKNS